MHSPCRRPLRSVLHDPGGDAGEQADHHKSSTRSRRRSLSTTVSNAGSVRPQIMSCVAMIEEAKAGWPSAATADVRRPFCPADLSHAEIRERAANSAATLATPTSSTLSLKQLGRTVAAHAMERARVEFCRKFRKLGAERK
jgi:hypothetical protein